LRVSPDRHERIFVVRMWQERDPRTESQWRGSVHDVANQGKRYVAGVEEIANVIAERLTDPKPEG